MCSIAVLLSTSAWAASVSIMRMIDVKRKDDSVIWLIDRLGWDGYPGAVSDTAPQTADQTPSRRGSRTRRTPGPGQRQRDAERTRERILDAALREFADKGYAGARVRQIAERAGVNAQLISYYFGGKEGLYGELVRRWHEWEAGVDQAGLSFADMNVAYLQATLDRPEVTRMFVWEGLTQGG